MTDINVIVRGILGYITVEDYKRIAQYLYVEDLELRKIYGGINNGNWTGTKVIKCIAHQISDDLVEIGLGALKYLMLYNPFVKFHFKEFSPVRTKNLDEFVVTEKLLNHPNFLLNGKPRDYFYEALKVCQTNTLGTISLPTQSGKTSIELTVAHNLRMQLGTGVMIVPTDILKQQMLLRAEEYGIPNVIDYKIYSKNPDKYKNDTYIIVSVDAMLDIRIKNHNFDKNLFNWMIIDECHHVASDRYDNIIHNCVNLSRAYGFSGSVYSKPLVTRFSFRNIPYKDALRINRLGLVLLERTPEQFIENKQINDVHVINFEYTWSPELSSDLIREFNNIGAGVCNLSDYSHILKLLCMNTERMQLIAQIQDILTKHNRLSILHTARKAYGYSMLDQLHRDDTALWYGSNKVYVNDSLMIKLKDFDSKKVPAYDSFLFDNVYQSKTLTSKNIYEYHGTTVKNLIMTSTGNEGLSFKEPITATILSEGLSSITLTQRAGRSTGRAPHSSIIINIYDKGNKVLQKHAMKRSSLLTQLYGNRPRKITTIAELDEYIKSLN